MIFQTLKLIKPPALAASVLTSCIMMSNAYAEQEDAYLYSTYRGENTAVASFYSRDFTSSMLDSLKKIYGDIGYAEKWTHAYSYNFFTVLRGSVGKKRRDVFTIEKLIENKYGNMLNVDLVMNSEAEALAVCDNLKKITSSPKTSIHAKWAYQDYAIAVPYWIAYDTGSKLAADGENSTPARKYIICTNYMAYELDPKYGDENNATGILSSKLDADKYEVTCMPGSRKPTTTFTPVGSGVTNGVDTYSVDRGILTNLHQYNKIVGAKYCPMSPPA